MSKQEFSIADGIAVQQEQMKLYKLILNEDTYNWLEKFVLEDNNRLVEGVDNGYSVIRGTDIQNMLFNYGRKLLYSYDR
jgi:hypothetical protein